MGMASTIDGVDDVHVSQEKLVSFVNRIQPTGSEVREAEGGLRADAVAASPHQRNESMHALQADTLQRHNT